MKILNPRKIAWQAVLEYQKNAGDPDAILDQLIGKYFDERDRNLAWEITKGTIRHLKRLDYMAQAYIKAPLTTQTPKILAALRIGFYQLIAMNAVPQFAAVDETVEIISESGMERDAGFLNAVFRAYIREPEKIKYPDPAINPDEYLSVYYSYPLWIVKRWRGRYGFEETTKMLIAGNQRPLTSFKLICRNMAQQDILNSLAADDIEIEPGKYFKDYFSSENLPGVIRSAWFQNGYINVQDESQGLPIYLLNPGLGDEVLDLCSAPGGKTVALAERVGPGGKVVSLDKDPNRLKFVRENVNRIGFGNVEFIESDLLEFAPGRKFKYILLDVPCSGLGTLATNVDLRWTKKEKDIGKFAALQRAMLESSAKLLADGGYMVYSTCTTEPEEIELVIEEFIISHPDIFLEDGRYDLLNIFRTQNGVYRTWPHKHGIGGGGFALLRKINGS
jgi:16S rRNA (cytosine967-C5)-methyltransferase